MKIILIIGVIFFCVIGFLFFLWLISKKEDKKPIENLKEQEKKEYDFIKEQQKIIGQTKKKQVPIVKKLEAQSRGAFFERAIERKKNEYRDDDKEYEQRLENIQPEKLNSLLVAKKGIRELEKKTGTKFIEEEELNKLQPQQLLEKYMQILNDVERKAGGENVSENEITEFQPVEHSLSSFIKKESNDEKQEVSKQDELEALKEKVTNYENKKEMDIERFKAEILLEAENIKKKRREFLMGSNAVSS